MIYSAAIFDLDGLVLDTETVSHLTWQRALADFDFTLDEDLYRKVIGCPVRNIEEAFIAAFGKDFPAQKVTGRRAQYFQQHIAEHGITLKPGLTELLAFLDEIKLPKAIATSSGTELATLKLTVSGLIDKFDAVVCGDQIKNGKPAPDIFLAAAEKLNAPPQQCLVLEDSDNGLLAAHAAGMTTIIIPDLKQPDDDVTDLAHRVFQSLHDVIPFLQESIDTDP